MINKITKKLDHYLTTINDDNVINVDENTSISPNEDYQELTDKSKIKCVGVDDEAGTDFLLQIDDPIDLEQIISSFKNINTDQLKNLLAYFQSSLKQAKELPPKFALARSNQNEALIIYGVNLTNENNNHEIIHLLESLITELNKKNKGLGFKWWLLIILVFLASSGIAFWYWKTHSAIDILDRPSLIKNIAEKNGREGIWSFYQQNFPALYKAFKENKNNEMSRLATDLLKPEFITDLWRHTHQAFWQDDKKALSIELRADQISRTILYDYFNKNIKVKAIINDQQNKNLLKSTAFSELSGIYQKNTIENIFYWTDSDKIKFSPAIFKKVLDRANVQTGWEWTDKQDKDIVKLKIDGLPLKFEKITALEYTNLKDATLFVSMENTDDKIKRGYIFNRNRPTIIETIYDNMIRETLENPKERNIAIEENGVKQNWNVKWYKFNPEVDVKEDELMSFLFEGILNKKRMKLIENSLGEELTNHELRGLLAENERTSLFNKSNLDCSGKNACGFTTTDPVVALVLSNLVRENTLLNDLPNIKPEQKIGLQRKGKDTHETHVLVTKNLNSSASSLENILSDDVLKYFKNDTVTLIIDEKEVVFYKLTDQTKFKENVFDVVGKKLHIRECFDNARIKGSDLTFIQTTNACEIK